MNLLEYIRKKNLIKPLIIVVALFVLLLVLQKFFIIALLLGASLAISFIVGTYQMSKSIGIELVTFTTILAGFAFSPTLGAMIGFVFIIMHLLIGHFASGIYVLWVVPLYAILGFLAGTLTGLDFVTLGVFMTIGLNAFNLIMTGITFPQNLGNYLPYSITNILFNLIVFYQFGPIIYPLVS